MFDEDRFADQPAAAAAAQGLLPRTRTMRLVPTQDVVDIPLGDIEAVEGTEGAYPLRFAAHDRDHGWPGRRVRSSRTSCPWSAASTASVTSRATRLELQGEVHAGLPLDQVRLGRPQAIPEGQPRFFQDNLRGHASCPSLRQPVTRTSSLRTDLAGEVQPPRLVELQREGVQRCRTCSVRRQSITADGTLTSASPRPRA